MNKVILCTLLHICLILKDLFQSNYTYVQVSTPKNFIHFKSVIFPGGVLLTATTLFETKPSTIIHLNCSLTSKFILGIKLLDP